MPPTEATRETARPTDLLQADDCFKNPHYNQQHSSLRQRQVGESNAYARYNPYGRYKGKRFTHYPLEAVRHDASLGLGKSNALHLSAGHRFDLTDHPSEARNRDYLLTCVKHTGQQPQALEALAGGGGATYSNDFSIRLGRFGVFPSLSYSMCIFRVSGRIVSRLKTLW